jgi:hypothetical protein
VEDWNRQHGLRHALTIFNHASVFGNRLDSYDFNELELDEIDFSTDVLWCSEFQNTKLAYARFCETRLAGVNFQGANLTAADFSYARCYGVTERGMVEWGNVPVGAKTSSRFTNAILDRAVFDNAMLHGVDFSHASLLNTKFVSSSLYDTNFENATLGGTVFSDVNLSGVKGLDSVKHTAPSFLDSQTLARSGNLPVTFLRGCGLSDILIDHIPSLFNIPIQFYSTFISYSGRNQIFTERLYADLQNRGVRCWLASEDLKIGAKIRVAIDESIHVHDKLLIVLSEDSVKSDWVEHEVETALERERNEKRTILFPIRLDDSVMNVRAGWPVEIRTRNIGNFCSWEDPETYQKALERLIRDLKNSELT